MKPEKTSVASNRSSISSEDSIDHHMEDRMSEQGDSDELHKQSDSGMSVSDDNKSDDSIRENEKSNLSEKAKDDTDADDSRSSPPDIPNKHPGPIPVGSLIDGRWTVGSVLGSGVSGLVQIGADENGAENVVIKSEPAGSDSLQQEAAIYEAIHRNGVARGFPVCYAYGSVGDCDIIILDRLGQTLENRGLRCLREVFEFMIQALHLFEHLHRSGYVHGDIHSENFMYGMAGTATERSLFMIDFSGATRIEAEDFALAARKDIELSNIRTADDLLEALDLALQTSQILENDPPEQLEKFRDYCMNWQPAVVRLPDYAMLRSWMVDGLNGVPDMDASSSY